MYQPTYYIYIYPVDKIWNIDFFENEVSSYSTFPIYSSPRGFINISTFYDNDYDRISITLSLVNYVFSFRKEGKRSKNQLTVVDNGKSIQCPGTLK